MTLLRVLIVEDSEDDALLLTDNLRHGGFDPQSQVVDDLPGLKSALAKEWDVIISDYVLPGFGGMDALEIVRQEAPDTPFLMVSGKLGEDVAIETMKAGAHDYILKSNLSRLVPAVQRELADAQVRRERKIAQQELVKARDLAEQAARSEADTRATLQAIFDVSPVGLVMVDASTRKVTYFNAAASDILGGPQAGITDMSYPGVCEFVKTDGTPYHPDEHPLSYPIAKGERCKKEHVVVRRRNGTEVNAHATCVPILDADGRVTGAVATLDDITEMVELQNAIEEALKRERHFSLVLQRALLPDIPKITEGYSIAVEYVPVFANEEIGGDFYDVCNVANRRAGILIGDVSGKGLEAAALAATTRSTVHAFVHETPSAAEALMRANAVIGSSPAAFQSFVTAFLVVLDNGSGHFSYSSAGHPPGMICRSNEKIELHELGGMPLGLGADRPYVDRYGHLAEGDRLILYTDGISEARRNGELLDVDGIERIVQDNIHLQPSDLAKVLIKGATDWAGGKLSDDAAVVIVERR